MVIVYHPESSSYGQPGHPERPERVIATEAHLRRIAAAGEWRRAGLGPDDSLLLAHTPEHLARLDQPLPFDGDTPYHENLPRLARLSAGAALEAVELARTGQRAFSLMRPPGHHCTAGRAMGFCYLNNISIAALEARRSGTPRVAVWDFDAHHGNGTEAILRGKEGILFVSVHQFPGYPGTGMASFENCVNLPVAPQTPADAHMNTLRASWDEVRKFEPDLVLVSAGFDAYRNDPITTMCLRLEDFLTLGCWMNEANLPAAALLEGGYSAELPQLVAAFLEGWRHG